jgi:excisionase family DNA binding protein
MEKKQFFTSISSDELKEMIQDCINQELGKFPSQSKETSDLIKAKEASELLQVSKVTLYNWMNDGVITGYYLGSRLYFKKSELIDSLSKKGLGHVK